MPRASAATERLEARVTPEQKALLRRAADLRGLSLTDFVVTTAQDAAERAVQTTLSLELSRRDQERLVKALLNPPEPSERLRKAAAMYNARSNRKVRPDTHRRRG